MNGSNEFLSDAERGVGTRLRKAREAQGLSIEDVAHRLKMPVKVVQSLEEEDWGRLGAPVFVRGQLRSYSRLLGLVTSFGDRLLPNVPGLFFFVALAVILLVRPQGLLKGMR